MKRTAFAALLVLVLCLACAANAENRLLVYMIGSDLETENGYASQDLQEMIDSFPENGGLEVLVCAGGAERWHGLIAPEKPSLYRLTGQGMEWLGSFDGGSMVDAETLAWFLSQTEPSDGQTALLLWNHGGGPLIGFGRDETDPDGRLQTADIVRVLHRYVQPESKLAWIGFDACLMGSLEMAGLLAPYAHYLIASEEVEMSCGWDYSFLERMAGDLSVPQLADHILSAYFDTTVAACGGDPLMMPAITLACYDLARYAAVAECLDALSGQMDASLDFSFPTLAHSRSSIPTMGRFSGGLHSEMVDLRRLVHSVQAYYPQEAEKLLSALEEMVVCCVSNHPNNSGVSVYLPFGDKAAYRDGMDQLYRQLTPMQGYRAFVDRFAQEWISGTLQQTQLAPEAKAERPSIHLTDELVQHYAKSYYVIAQDFGADGFGFYYMGSETVLDGHVLSADYPMRTAYLVSGEERFPIFLTRQEEDERRVLYHASALLVRMDEEMADFDIQRVQLQIAMDRQTYRCTVVGAYLEDEEQLFGKRRVDLAEWDWLQAVFTGFLPAYTADGVLLPFADWEPSGTAFGMEIFLREPFSIEMAPIGETETDLYCQIVVEDVYGNRSASDLIPLRSGNAPPDDPT